MMIAIWRGRRSGGISSVGSAPSPDIGRSQLLDGDRLLALRTNRNHANRLANELAHSAQISLRIRRQLLIGAAGRDLFFPPRYALVDRLRAAKIIDMAGELIGRLAIDRIGRADLQLVEPA